MSSPRQTKVSRRGFAKGAFCTPLVLAYAGTAAAAPAKQERAGGRNVASLSSHKGFDPTFPSARLKPVPLRRVRLLDGPFRDAQTWNIAFLKRQDPDRLLHVFRLNAGLPSTAKPLGGWEAPDCELRGHFVGHYLSACALLSASTGDAEMKRRGDYLVDGLAACQKNLDAGGYLSAFPIEFFDRLDLGEQVWAPFYTVHKIMAGLFDMYRLAGNKRALDVLLGMAAWVDGWTAVRARDHMQEILNSEFGGMSEVLYNLAASTGDKRWAAVGDRFNKEIFLEPLALRVDQLKGMHMNTHVPQVIGAARRYEISGDRRYREISQFFWETVTNAHAYVTGGSSNKELWLTEPYRMNAEWSQSTNHQECCCAYNMLKLTRHLYGWDPAERYIAYYERNLFNHRLGTIEPGTGRTGYFLSMAPGAWKTLATDEATYWCCTGTAIEEFSKLADTIYYDDGRGIYVNLFIASKIDWPERRLKLTQETRFPDEAKTTLTIREAPGGEWPLYIRIPSWTDNPQVFLDGRRLEAVAAPGGYMKVSRAWQPGDRLDIELPMRLHSEGFPDMPSRQALLVGPIVLAGQFAKGDIPDVLLHEQKGPSTAKLPLPMPKLHTGGKPLETIIKPVADKPLTFVTVDQPQNITFRPLNESWERFTVYWETV